MEKEKEAKNPTDVIILNRMYAGEYLDENIGHEVINLIKPDEGDDYYVYINDKGNIIEDFHNGSWRATCILFTRWCTREYKDGKKIKKLSMQEVLAKTEGDLENLLKNYKNEDFYKKYSEELEKVTYGKYTLKEIIKLGKDLIAKKTWSQNFHVFYL